MTSPEAYQALALSLGLGLLVGLQRQREGSPIAGIRSFPLVTLMGTLAVVIGGGELLWVVIAGLVCLASLLIIGNVIKLSAGEFDPGITTEVVTFYLATGLRKVAGGGGDETESITVHEVPLAQAEQWLEERRGEGVLIDPKVYAGLYFATTRTTREDT
ncbi:MAG TPA: MgtC/SapB family protein [Planctomycetota bacterium]|nr:MgtC/SapB family protein [Planctomycetota bacterium]